jgi:hypothetical protein
MNIEFSPSWKHRFLSAFLLFHLISMGASLFKKTAVGAWFRQGTGPYERALGIWQSWGMFGPPPNGSSYLVATGITPQGESLDLPVLVGELDSSSFRWTYSRSLKLERSTFSPASNFALRQGYGTWLCTRAAAMGNELERVELWKRRYMHPDAQELVDGAAGPPEIRRVDLQVIECSGEG